MALVIMRSTGRRHNILARILIGIGLIFLARGSMLMAAILLGIGTEPIVTPEQSEGAALLFFYLWPSVLAIASIFGITALLVSQKKGVGALVFASFLAWIGVE